MLNFATNTTLKQFSWMVNKRSIFLSNILRIMLYSYMYFYFFILFIQLESRLMDVLSCNSEVKIHISNKILEPFYFVFFFFVLTKKCRDT